MEFVVIAIVAIFASGLTLFSGFGLGTILLPAFALFFPIDIAITLTAIVHLLNNFFKLTLLGKYASLKVVLRFGPPAILAAFAGAYLLTLMKGTDPLLTYTIAGSEKHIELVKLVIGILIIIFALMEFLPAFDNLSFQTKYLPLGGVLSGFFGGLSGHQGALRSAFLIRLKLTKETFIATGVVIACMIDISRISVYSTSFLASHVNENIALLITATLAAFAGAYAGRNLLKKVTYTTIRIIVGIMLIFIGVGISSGMI